MINILHMIYRILKEKWDEEVEEIFKKSEAERVWAEKTAQRMGIEIKVVKNP